MADDKDEILKKIAYRIRCAKNRLSEFECMTSNVLTKQQCRQLPDIIELVWRCDEVLVDAGLLEKNE
jgi:hypothetical protein